jgi:hypothetical protein
MKMSNSVTECAERYKILFSIISQPSAWSDVVDLKIECRAAVLAVPSIAREHLAAEAAVRFGFKPLPRPLRFEPVQGCSSPSRAIAAVAPREEP